LVGRHGAINSHTGEAASGLPFLQHEPATLFFGEAEFLGCSGLCDCPARRIHAPEEFAMRCFGRRAAVVCDIRSS
jgi:hypothetical protein